MQLYDTQEIALEFGYKYINITFCIQKSVINTLEKNLN